MHQNDISSEKRNDPPKRYYITLLVKLLHYWLLLHFQDNLLLYCWLLQTSHSAILAHCQYVFRTKHTAVDMCTFELPHCIYTTTLTRFDIIFCIHIVTVRAWPLCVNNMRTWTTLCLFVCLFLSIANQIWWDIESWYLLLLQISVNVTNDVIRDDFLSPHSLLIILEVRWSDDEVNFTSGCDRQHRFSAKFSIAELFL